jgi:hypothetical protein
MRSMSVTRVARSLPRNRYDPRYEKIEAEAEWNRRRIAWWKCTLHILVEKAGRFNLCYHYKLAKWSSLSHLKKSRAFSEEDCLYSVSYF